MKKTVATIGLGFDSNKTINESILQMPEGTEILSVQSKNDNATMLQINFMTSTSMFESDLWKEYNFVICKCNYTEIDIDNHKYIGNINVKNDSFAVFYKEGLIV